MLKTYSIVALMGALFVGLLALAQAPSPRLASVTPDTGKAGTEFTAAGEHLAKANVSELYLTNGKDDLKADIVAQEAASIKFKTAAKPGRYSLMLLTADRARFLEQPVRVTIE